MTLPVALSMVIGIGVAAGLTVGALEIGWLWSRRRLDRAALREMALSLGQIPPNMLVSVAMVPVWLALYVSADALLPTELPVNAVTIPLAFVAVDLSYYVEHRCAHRIAFLWKLYHAMHHGSSACTVATAYRVSFLNQLIAPAFYLPWIVLGFDPVLIAGLQLAVFHYQAWLHTEMIGPVRWFDWIFNSPANHRMHHSRAPEHRDVNLGAVTMVWDRLFGTHAIPAGGLDYGIPGQAPPRRFVELFTRPWTAGASGVDSRASRRSRRRRAA